MTTPADVLAVLAKYWRRLDLPEDLLLARQAIAELIEADREYDAAYAEFPPVGAEKAAIERAAARINAARVRRSAALAGIATHSAVEPQQDPDHAAMLRDSIAQADEPATLSSSPASEVTP